MILFILSYIIFKGVFLYRVNFLTSFSKSTFLLVFFLFLASGINKVCLCHMSNGLKCHTEQRT